MTGSLYYKHHTAPQSLYYSMRSVAQKTFRVRPDIENIFQGEFEYPIDIFRDTIPFVALQPASTVLHAGFDRTYFDKGLSHPLIEAAIVGKGGMVRCIDPDKRNIDALNGFAESHGLLQLSAQQNAVWDRPGDLKFAFDNDWGPMSGTLSIHKQAEYASKKPGNRLETVSAVLIDDIVPEFFGDRPLGFLALTINGAEPQALEGAKKTLSSSPQLHISMALSSSGHFSFEIRKRVCDQMMAEGWDVVVSNSLHDPWSPNVFLWCIMMRENQKFIKELGASQVTWEQLFELASNESALVKNRADQIKNHILTEGGLFWRGVRKAKRESKKIIKSLITR